MSRGVLLTCAVAVSTVVVAAPAGVRADSSGGVGPDGQTAPGVVAGPVEVVAPAATDPGWKPVQVADRSGTVTVVWDRESGGRYAAQRSPAGVWSAPALIGCTSYSGCGAAHLGVDAAGVVTAVWDELVGSRSLVRVTTKPVGGPWSAPVTLTSAPDRLSGYEPRLDVAADGAAVIAWTRIRQDGVWVVRKAAGADWAQAPVRSFRKLASVQDVAIGSRGDVLVVGDDDPDDLTPRVLLRRFVPGTGWHRLRVLGTEGGFFETALVDVGPGGQAAVAWNVDAGHFARSAVVVRRMDRRGHWHREVRLSRWFGQRHPASVNGVQVGPGGGVTVVWTARTARASSRVSGTWVNRTVVPRGGTLVWDSVTANAGGDLAATWSAGLPSVGALMRESIHVSLRGQSSLTWQRSGTLGVSSCGTGDRGDPGCRPFSVAVLPDGSAVVAWFDLSNALLARRVAAG